MKITGLKTFVIGSGWRNLILLRLETDVPGLYGIGEATVQWGDEGSYDGVKKDEVGRGTAMVKPMETHVEQFTIRHESKGSWAALVLEWEKTRVVVPLK